MVKLFITGICGFIGRNIAQRALELNYDVSGVDIKIKKIPGATITKADIRNKNAMMKLTKNVDYVIHLAAVTSNLEFERQMPRSYEINVNGFNSVIESAYKNGCEKFLYASSSAVYKNMFSEDTIIDLNNITNHYAKTKLINEAVGKSYKANGLLNTVGLRFFNVYGPGENDKGNYASIITIFKKYAQIGRPIVIYGNGKQERDLIYVMDVANITLNLMKKANSDLYNVGTGKSTSYNEIADMLGYGKRRYIRNPLSTYQYFTRADTKRLADELNKIKFTTIKEGIFNLQE